MKPILLLLFLIIIQSLSAQDSTSSPDSATQTKQDSVKPAPVTPKLIAPARLRNPDSIRAVDSVKAIADSILHSTVEKKMRPIESLYNVPPHPSIYGQWVGGYLVLNILPNVPKARVREIERVPPSFEWIFYLFCGVLIMLSFLRLAFFKFFQDLFRVFFNTSMRQKQIREQLSQSSLPSLLLNIFFFITGGIFIYFLITYLGYDTDYPLIVTMLICIGALALLYLGKYIFLSMAGWMFDKKSASENYMFTVFMVNKMAGLFLLPMDILMAYSDQAGKQVVITVTVIGLIILGTIRMIRGFQSVNNILRINPLHYILYVAAFEVIPVLLIYKVLLIVIR